MTQMTADLQLLIWSVWGVNFTLRVQRKGEVALHTVILGVALRILLRYRLRLDIDQEDALSLAMRARMLYVYPGFHMLSSPLRTLVNSTLDLNRAIIQPKE